MKGNDLLFGGEFKWICVYLRHILNNPKPSTLKSTDFTSTLLTLMAIF